MKARVYLGDGRQVVARLELELTPEFPVASGKLVVPYTLKKPWLSTGNSGCILLRSLFLGRVQLWPAPAVDATDFAVKPSLDISREFPAGCLLSITVVWHEYAARNDRKVKRELARLGLDASGRDRVTGAPNPARRGRK